LSLHISCSSQSQHDANQIPGKMHIQLFFKHMCTYKCYLNYIFLKSGLTQVVFVLLVVVAKFIGLGSTEGNTNLNEADVKGNIQIIAFVLLLFDKWWVKSHSTTWLVIIVIFRTLIYPKNTLELLLRHNRYYSKCEHPVFRDFQYLWHERRRLHLSRWAQESHGQIRHRANGPETSRDIQSIWHRWR